MRTIYIGHEIAIKAKVISGIFRVVCDRYTRIFGPFLKMTARTLSYVSHDGLAN